MAGRFETVIVDVERQPVAGAVVSFYALPDSALVDAVTADAAGRVTFANANAMALRAQAIGFLPLVAATDAWAILWCWQDQQTSLGNLW